MSAARPRPDGAEGFPTLEPWRPIVAEVGKLAIVAIIAVNLLNAYAIIAGPFEEGREWFLMNQESNISTWLSVMLLAGAGLLAGVCAAVDVERRRRFFVLACLALLAMSLDEAATVHERVGGLVGTIDDSTDLTYLWVIPWTVLALAIGLVLWRSRPELPPTTRRWLLAGACIGIGGAVILEVVATKTVNSGGSDTAKLSLYSVEENLELIGALIMAFALARHALLVGGERDESSTPVSRAQ